ncbi:MAG TPA: hypothetical protein VH637_03760 [Streptosporangiaceae bacterium]|jgi:hypothetical protein
MKSDDIDRLRGIAPGTGRPPELFTAAEREALFAAAIAERSDRRRSDRRPGPARHPVRTWAARLVPLAVVAAAGAAVAVIAFGPGATNGPGAANPRRAAAGHRHPAAAPQIRTAAYVQGRAVAALANQDTGTLRVTTTYSNGVSRDIQDLGSGATRTTFTAPDGTIQEDDAATGTGDSATTTIVDYAVRAWWTIRNEGGSDLTGSTGPSLRQQLAGGALAIVGDDTVDGQRAIHLRYTSRTFTVNGKKYGVDTSDVWVSASTFLPIRETGTDGRWTATMTWSPQPPTHAELTPVPPAGFAHRHGPPPSLLQTGGGLG